jgi:lipoprotein-releasing system permease protein
LFLHPVERLIAFRYLRARRGEGFIALISAFSLIGIALGVATLIVVMAVMNGVRGELVNSLIGLGGQVTVYARSAGIDDYDALTQKIRSMNGITSALPVVEGQVMASYRGHAQGAIINGLRVDDLQYKPMLKEKIVAGDIGAFAQGQGVLIGRRMASRLGLQLGDSITLISPEGRSTIAGMVPRVKAYPVVGLFEIGIFVYDTSLVILPLDEAQQYFKLRDAGADRVTQIEVVGRNPDDAETLGRKIDDETGHFYRVDNWKDANAQIFRAIMAQRNVMFLILTLIIIVASFNIISSLIMLVRSKRRDIAILRTMGATRRHVLRIFFACGASIGVAGTAIGTLLGLLIACNTEAIQHWIERQTGQELLANELYFLSTLPSKVNPWEVCMVVALALGLSFLATLYPAMRASRLDPAEVLRYE